MTWCGRRCPADLEKSGCDSDADSDQHDATQSLAPFADLATQKTAKLQPGQSHRDAHRADENGTAQHNHQNMILPEEVDAEEQQ